MTHSHSLTSLTMLALLAGSTLVGCDSNTNSSGAVPQTTADAHDHDHGDHDHGDADRTPDTYSGIRGEITQLPDSTVPGSELKIHHEQIRDFKTKDGTISVTKEGIAGMRSMTMPFPLGEGVSLDSFSIGDKVSFDFVVNWGNNRPAWEITSIEKLPADTELDFNNAIEDMADDAMDDATDAVEGMMDHGDHDHEHGGDHDGP